MNKIAKSLSIAGLLAAFSLSHGLTTNISVIAQVVPGTNLYDLAYQFHARIADSSVNHNFVNFVVRTHNEAENLETALRSDARILWAEDNIEVDYADSPDNRASTTGAGKGSTIGAVFDPGKTDEDNKMFMQQIHYTPITNPPHDREIKVAILDTGLGQNVPHLWSHVIASANMLRGRGMAFDAPEVVDSNGDGVIDGALGHGSMVTGLVNRLAPNASLVICKIADADGSTDCWSLIKGIAYAVDKGCEVANISMGSLNAIPAVEYADSWAKAHNLTLVYAGGNAGLSRLLSPADSTDGVSVVGVDIQNSKAPFSCYGRHSTVAAPAIGIHSSWWDGTEGIWSGTSFAAPMVTGAIADALRLNQSAVSVDTIVSAVKDSNTDLNQFNPLYVDKLGGLLHCGRLRSLITSRD